MKKSFKRFLSSVLATVVAVASMSIGMTVTASAATNTYELIPSDPVVNTSDYFGGTLSFQTNAGALATTSVVNAAGDTVAISRGYKLNKGAKVTFTTTSNSSTVTVLWSARLDKDATCSVGLDGTVSATATKTDGLKTETYTDVAAGTHTIERGVGESVLYYVRVDENFSDNAKTYTINGTCNLADTSFTIGDMDAKVDANGNWTASVTAESAPFAVGDTLAVSLGEYAASPESVTLAAGTDELTFDGGNITFTKYELQAIAAGTYDASNIEAGLPNFDKSALKVSSAGKYTGDLKLILSDVATITVNGKCGSTTEGNSASVTVNGEKFTSNAKDEFADYTFVNVPAGEQTIAFESSNTTFQVASITVTYGSTDVTTYTWVLDTSALSIGIDTSKLSLANTTTTSTTNTLQYTGTDYTLNADNVTVTGTPDATNVITVTPQDSWFTKVAPPAGAITDKATLQFSESVTTLEADDKVIGDFTIIAGKSSKIDNKSSSSAEGFGAFEFAYNCGGKTTLDKATGLPTNRAIKFATADAATVQFVARSTSDKSTSTINVYASDGTIVGSSSALDNTAAHIVKIDLPKADTYYIATADQAFRLYYVNVVVGETITSVDNTKSVFTDTNDAYIIAKVSSADVVQGKTLVMQYDGSTVDESDVVYKGAIIDGQYVTAEELSADFIYVVKAVGAALDKASSVVVSIVNAL